MASSVLCLGVGAQTFFARKICRKNNKMPEFWVNLARKIIKIPEFFCYNFPKKLSKLHKFCPKKCPNST